MNILTLDFESYYSTQYSLRKMTPIEYILNKEFECHGLAVKRNREPSFWVDGLDVGRFLAKQDTNVMMVAHNAPFDAAICVWRYGWVPKMICDTLGIARAILQKQLKSLSLDSVAKHMGLGKKTGALANVMGMRLAEIKQHPDLHRRYVEYGMNDADLCFGIFDRYVLSGEFPRVELAIMDAIIRCTVQPQFRVNRNVLAQSLEGIQKEKERTLQLISAMGAGKEDLMSNDKFAELLRANGVEPPTKISGITGKQAYAFAKSDEAFLDLLDHPSTTISTLVATRLGHKSTIEESRHERFLKIADLDWPATPLTPGGKLALMPMPLRYAGAHTHRLSGEWSLNVQNMGRGSKLRQSLEAPAGHVVVAGDESQVEARFVATLCGQEDLRKAFEDGIDVYCSFASDLFSRSITKADKIERWIGKTCILGLGFGLGDENFTKGIPVLSFNQLGTKILMPSEEGKRVVNLYRTRYAKIKQTWKLLGEQGIHALATGDEWWWGPVLFRKEEILLPNGLSLFYHNLKQVAGGRFGHEWVFEYAGKTKRCYGGMLLENIVQALARIVVMEAAVRIKLRLAKLGIPLALQVHDELVFVVKKEYEQVVRFVLTHELRVRPTWLPNVPLDCEVGSGDNYGDAK